MSVDLDLCIVGAGISGLSLAAFVRKQTPSVRLLVLEQSHRPGGVIGSQVQEGYLAEWGPHGFLDNCAESLELIRLAGLEAELVQAPLARFIRYICLRGALQPIAQSPWRLLSAPLMALSAKLRVAAEYWQAPLDGEPSVAQWVKQRFGPAMLPFADAVFTGTYAGDIERLSMDAVMPGLRRLEQEHGSVLRGLIQGRRRHEQQAKQKTLPAMLNFHSGMQRLPQALAQSLSAEGLLRYDCQLKAVRRETNPVGGWRLDTLQGTMRCRQLALALPLNQSLALLRPALSFLPSPCLTIPEARIASVLLGFDDSARIPFGFGYLAPEQEQRFTLGALFSTHMFPGRAPAGRQLVEALVGGRRHPERLELDDAKLMHQVYEDLRQLMPLPKPCYSAVLRPASGIPQLEAGYLPLLNWRSQAQEAMGGALQLCGFGWKGIGLNDMVREAKHCAQQLVSQLPSQQQAAVKGVYF